MFHVESPTHYSLRENSTFKHIYFSGGLPDQPDFFYKLRQANILDSWFVEKCLHVYSREEEDGSAAVFILDRVDQDIIDFNEDRKLYILSYGYYLENPAIKREIEKAIADPEERDEILYELTDILGEDHHLTQECLMLASGFDNQHNPDGFLAIHQAMMEKSVEVVTHPVRSLTPGCFLNTELIKEPRPKRAIHMPLNVWNRLFEQLKAMDPEERDIIRVDISLESLLELQGHPLLANLLDPLDSLKTKPDVTGHSQMLRMVLKNIQDTQNINAFLQLLVNITTCTTGKLNGIVHSYVFMAQDRVLDESSIGTESFKANIVDFFKEDLRRFRESCVSHVVFAITEDRDQHDVSYVRGVIGRELGLLLEDEVLLIDLNSNAVDKNLRLKTKQELLDLL